jgi:hypothetical protein
MPVIFDSSGVVYRRFSYETESEFEAKVISLADQLFGSSTIYIDVKKKIKGADIASIPDGYVVDMTQPATPRLYVLENEIVSHDPFKHIGIQMLKFVTGFDEAKLTIRQLLMKEIAAAPGSLKRLQLGCEQSSTRNVDAYLDMAVYGDFAGIVVVDEAHPELHRVLEKINANISVLELRTYRSDAGGLIHEFDTLYDEDDEVPIVIEKSPALGKENDSSELRKKKRARRAASDTVIVPAREDGFKQEFLGNHQWMAIRISPAMKDRIKYIAAYQVAPVSAVTHLAEVQEIKPYKDTGKYQLIFKGAPEQIGPIPPGNINLQGPAYVQRNRLVNAKTLVEALAG